MPAELSKKYRLGGDSLFIKYVLRIPARFVISRNRAILDPTIGKFFLRGQLLNRIIIDT